MRDISSFSGVQNIEETWLINITGKRKLFTLVVCESRQVPLSLSVGYEKAHLTWAIGPWLLQYFTRQKEVLSVSERNAV